MSRFILAHRTKLVVTVGVLASTVLTVYGLDHHAIWAGLATNIVWIWE